MKKSLFGLLWGESSFKVSSILYSSVITAFLLQLGLKNSQIGTLWSIVLFSQMMFDYPTGGFADKFGRLKIFMVGMIFMGIAILLTANSTDIRILYFAAALLGFGESQVSGSLFPWFVNSIEDEQEEKKNFILTANAQKQYVTNIIGIFTGFFISIFNIDYRSILILAGILHIGNGILLYAFFQDNKSSESNLINIGKKSFKIFQKDYKLWGYTLAMTVSFSFHTVYLFIWQPVQIRWGLWEVFTILFQMMSDLL